MPATPSLVQPVDVRLPRLPASLEGFRIAHITDLHARRRRPRFASVAALLANQRVDLVALTGDFMDKRDHKELAVEVLADFCRALRPRLGFFGVFGNHDSAEFRRLCQPLPVHWLSNRVYRHDRLPLEILGLDTDTGDRVDALSLLLHESWPKPAGPENEKPLRLLLAHLPTTLLTASDLSVDFMLAGHTHGGQIRPFARPLINSMKWPLRFTTGMLRHRQTIAYVSRGLGEAGHLAFRLFCRPHVPLYTLRRGPLPGPDTDALTCLHPW